MGGAHLQACITAPPASGALAPEVILSFTPAAKADSYPNLNCTAKAVLHPNYTRRETALVKLRMAACECLDHRKCMDCKCKAGVVPPESASISGWR